MDDSPVSHLFNFGLNVTAVSEQPAFPQSGTVDTTCHRQGLLQG